MAVGELRIIEARPQLLKMVYDENRNVQVGVRFALHRLGDKRLSHDLEHYASDPDPGVRANTALALGLLGEPSALKILRPMALNRNTMVFLQVAEARWRLGDEAALKDLVTASVSRYADDQIIAFLAIAGPRDQRVIEHLRGGLTAEYPEVRLVAARAVGMLGSDEGYVIANNGSRSPDPRQRALAA